MEYVVKILNLAGFNGVTVDSDPLVFFAGSIWLLAILAIFAFFLCGFFLLFL